MCEGDEQMESSDRTKYEGEFRRNQNHIIGVIWKDIEYLK